jgi:hypothetical protein
VTLFYLGTHQPTWLSRVRGVPLFVSHRRLAPYVKLNAVQLCSGREQEN